MNKEIAVYDNTISARTYLSYIAEQAGGFACVGRDGKLYIKNFRCADGKKIAEGNNITLNDLKNVYAKIKPRGYSLQETRDGKNKFNLDYIRQPFSNYKITDTGVNITKCWVADLYTSENVIKTFKPNTTYTMKVKAKVVSRPSTMVSSQNALFALYRATSGDLPSVWRECISMPDKGTIALNKEKEYVTTFTTPADMTNVRFLAYTFYGNNDGSTTGTVLGEIDISEIMLVEGSYTSETFPEFELYGVSPTSKYLSPIRNAGDNINIFDKSNVNKLSAYFWSGSTIQTLNTRRIIYVPCKPNTMYSVSKKAGKKFILSTTKVTPALGVQTFEFVQEDTASLLSLKTPPDARYLLVQYFDTSADTLTEQEILDSIKIEEGVGTSYSPHNCGNINIFKVNKNLANMDLLYQKMQSFNTTNLSQKIVDERNCIAFSNSSYQNVRGFKGLPNRYKENTRYKFSFYARLQDTSDTAKNYSLFLQTFDKSGKLINNVRCPNATEWTKFELITPENTSLYYFDFSYSNPAMWLIDKETFMIEEYKEGKSSNYIKNQEQNIVFPLNEGQRLYKNSYLAEDGIHHKRNQIELDGTENWIALNKIYYMQVLDKRSNKVNTKNAIMSNQFLQTEYMEGSGSLDKGYMTERYYTTGNLNVFFNYDDGEGGVSNWKTYLASQKTAGTPVILEYELAEEKIEPYTEEQKRIFNILDNFKLYEDINYIKSNSDMEILSVAEIELRLFKSYKWGEKFQISRVRYEDGVQLFEKGNTTGNTVYINQDNIYILDQEQIDKIYDDLNELEVYSFTGESTIDPAYDIGDIIVIDNKKIIYQGQTRYGGKWIANINSKIQSKEKEETTTRKPSQKTINRRVQSRINQAEGKIEQLAEETSENSEKITKHEQDINGITQSVSEVKTEIKSVDSKADSINKNLSNNYYTRTQTENKITQTAESTISEVSKTYSTKTETSNAKQEAIKSANSETDNKLKGYTETSKLGTAIEQNYEHVKVAWNQISDFIQMMIINNNASFAILDKNKKVIMALDKNGQHFYKEDGNEFGEMGVNKIDNQNYISFGVTGEYEKEISNGMAWGITTKSDGKFWPVLYIKNFAMGPKNSDGSSGELVLSGCNLVLEGIGNGILSGSIKIYGDPGGDRLYFVDISSNKTLLDIKLGNVLEGNSISILNKIKFYENDAGSNTFKIGDSNNYVILTDAGDVSCQHIYCDGDMYSTGYLTAEKGISCPDGYVSGIAFVNNSRVETKKNIKKYKKKALNEIINTDIYSFNYNVEGDKSKKHIGFIIGDKYRCSEEILAQDKENNKIGADIYSMVSLAYKAIQEQQEQIEELKSIINKQQEQIDKIIEN